MSTLSAFVLGAVAGVIALTIAVLIVTAAVKRRYRVEFRLNAWMSSELRRLDQDPGATGEDYADVVLRYGRLLKLSREGDRDV